MPSKNQEPGPRRQDGDRASLHVQISDLIRDRIYANEWPPGSQLPSEFSLAETFGASRSTIQKSLLTLAKEGLVERSQGRGTFVKKPDLQYATGNRFLSFAESLRLQGVEFRTDVLLDKVLPAHEAEAEHFAIDEGEPILHLHRLRVGADGPILYQEGRVNVDECPGIEDVDFSQEALFDAMERTSGRQVAYSKTRYAARVVGRERGEILKLDAHMPILNLDMTVYLSDNTPVEWGTVWLPSDKFVLASVTQRI